MNLVREDKDKKIFIDGNNKFYSMINMGNYVGHRDREWYDSNPDVWVLMFYDEKRTDGKTLHIEALLDDEGNYIRFIIELEGQKRVIQLDNGKVFKDTITEIKDISDWPFGDEFIALDEDIYSRKCVLLDSYLNSNSSFYLGDRVYSGELSNNNLIFEFLRKNDELKEKLGHSKKR